MSRIVVRVTQEHIDACGHSGMSCPLAKAIHEEGTYPFAWVGEGYWLASGFAWLEPKLPLSRRASDFVTFYDAGYPVEPSRFILETGD